MAEGVVDCLEAVEVEAEDRDGLPGLTRLQGSREFLAKQHAVRQAGEAVMVGHMVDLRLRAQALARLLLEMRQGPSHRTEFVTT